MSEISVKVRLSMGNNRVRTERQATGKPNFGSPARRVRGIAIVCGLVAILGALAWSSIVQRTVQQVASFNRSLAAPANVVAAVGAKKPAVQAPFDVGAVVRQVHLAYRETGSTFEAGDSGYRVKVEAGRMTLTPYHDPNGAPLASAPKRESSRSRLSQPDARWRDSSRGAPAQTGTGAASSPEASQRLEGSPFSLETVAVTRGSTSLLAPEDTSIGEQGELRIDRGMVTEVLRNTELGVEQSWELVEKPDGNGDLTFRVAAVGHELRSTNDDGLHFAGSAHGLGFVYGNGTLVDAHGARYGIPARYENGDIVLQITHELVERVGYPAVLDPTIGPEFEVSEPVWGVPSWYSRDEPTVACGGTNCLVVWTDLRNSETSEYDVYGVRVSAAGVVLDETGIPISVATHFQGGAAVAYDGANYLVVWRDARNGSDNTAGDIYGARVSTAGAVLETSGIAISRATDFQGAPAVACSGVECLVVWQDARGSFDDIYGARISNAGGVLDSAGVLISGADYDQTNPAIAYDGTNYFVVWEDSRNDRISSDIYAARVSVAGSVLDSAGIALSTAAGYQRTPVVAFGGTNYLVVWQDERDTATSLRDVYGTRVNTAGDVLDTAGIAISTATSSQSNPALAHDGTNFLVAWSEYRNDGASSGIFGKRVSAKGEVLDASDIAIGVAASSLVQPALAYDGVQYLAVWENFDSTMYSDSLGGARVTPAGVVQNSPAITLDVGANRQQEPAVAYNGTNYLVVWEDCRNGKLSDADVYAARVSQSGTILDGTGIAISTAAKGQLRPTVASNGADYLVVWRDTRYSETDSDIYAARVTSDGTVLDSAGIALSKGGYRESDPAVASNGSNYLVAWDDSRNNGTTGHDIFGVRVNALGVAEDPSGLAISTAANDQLSPALASDGANYLVVWEDDRNTSNPNYTTNIYGARVTPAGTVQDSAGIAISTTVGYQRAPAVAYGGANYFVVWQDNRNRWATGYYDLYGARVSPAAGVLDPAGIVIDKGTGEQQYPSVAHDGTNYLVAWLQGGSAIYGTRVNPAGALVDTAPWVLKSFSGAQQIPTLAAGKGGQILLAYETPARGSVRVHARLVMPDCTVTATSDTDCNGIDENCSGEADEGFTGELTACGIGACARAGLMICSAGKIVDGCVAGTAATSDATCDGIDDDCNGSADEDYLSHATVCGVGVCTSTGLTSCFEGVEQNLCTPLAAPSPSDETCDGSDDNCNGMVDEDYAAQTTNCGVGACARVGSTYCVGGLVKEGCVPGGSAAYDTTCDGVDDDCDGTADEDFLKAPSGCGGFLCGHGACESSCVSNDNCTSDHYCHGGLCATKLDDGQACSDNGECAKGHCVDGYCCENACSGQCEACGEQGHRGQCIAISGAPRGERVHCATDGSLCGGACDGVIVTTCSYPAAPTLCRAASCAAGEATLQAYCDGQGACPKPQTQACDLYGCDGLVCGGDCNAGYDCSNGKWCSAGLCVPKLDDGSSCGAGAQCNSGHCVDGLCCNTACAEQCGACNVAGHEGICSAVPAGEAPRNGRVACVGTGDCGGSCNGTTLNACGYPAQSTQCRAGSCVGGVASWPSVCDGSGVCPEARSQSCAPNTCSPNGLGCLGQCQLDSECIDGYWCSAGVCIARREPGAACGGPNECVSKHCVDGVCCNTACDGQCAACNVAGSVGQCSATPKGEAPRGNRAACAGTGVCAGLCNGASQNACSYPGTSTRCGEEACNDGIVQGASFCDAAGSCVAGENVICPKGCAGRACAATGSGGPSGAAGAPGELGGLIGTPSELGGALGIGGFAAATMSKGEDGSFAQAGGAGLTGVVGTSRPPSAGKGEYLAGSGCDCQNVRNSSANAFGWLTFLAVGLCLKRRRR